MVALCWIEDPEVFAAVHAAALGSGQSAAVHQAGCCQHRGSLPRLDDATNMHVTNGSLGALRKPGMTPDELYDTYKSFGDDPFIVALGEAPLGERFSAWTYAKDMALDLMSKTEHTSYCPFKGTASYWTVKVGDKNAENAIWGYESPYDETAPLAGHYAFYGNRVDSIEIT